VAERGATHDPALAGKVHLEELGVLGTLRCALTSGS